MIQELSSAVYHNEFTPRPPEKTSIVLSFQGRECLVRKDGGLYCFFTLEMLQQAGACRTAAALQYLFRIDDTGYYLAEPPAPEMLPAEAQWIPVAGLRTGAARNNAFAGATARQLYDWYRTRKFCPACGSSLEHSHTERAMHCPACGLTEYPKICPGVIVAVVKDDWILVTRYASWKSGMALVAGYAEIGETIEQTAIREVREETGLEICNLRYFESQPWSFGDTLLLGFWAQPVGDAAPRADQVELSEAFWASREELPEDDGISMTRHMLSLFRHGYAPYGEERGDGSHG